jgi:tRNA (adenine37-N6)-methyltransferase
MTETPQIPQVPQSLVQIRPIGVVVSDFKEFSQPTSYTSESMIFIREDLELGLTGLEHFSHIYVFYYQHRKKEWQRAAGWAETDEQILTMPLAGEPTCKGIYTTRAPARPSGIGTCVCELLRRRGNKLWVKGLDAFNGTAILDIKIYLPRYDSFPNATEPLHWCARHDLAETSQTLHWDTMNVGVTLGMRAALRAMRELGVARGEADSAEVVGGNFFAQGVEGVSGCSVLRGTMQFEMKTKSTGDWTLVMRKGERCVRIELFDRLFAGADEVLSLEDAVLFSSVDTANDLQAITAGGPTS